MQWVIMSLERWTRDWMHTCMSKGSTYKKEGQSFCIQAELNKWPYWQLKTNITQLLRYVTPTFGLPVNYETQNLLRIGNNWRKRSRRKKKQTKKAKLSAASVDAHRPNRRWKHADRRWFWGELPRKWPYCDPQCCPLLSPTSLHSC